MIDMDISVLATSLSYKAPIADSFLERVQVVPFGITIYVPGHY